MAEVTPKVDPTPTASSPQSTSPKPTTPKPTTPEPTTPKPSGPLEGIMDKAKALGGALLKKGMENVEATGEKMNKEMDKDKDEDKEQEKGEGKGKDKKEENKDPNMEMLIQLAKAFMELREEVIDFVKKEGPKKLDEMKENKDVQAGLKGLKDVASEASEMFKGMMSKGPQPGAKKGKGEEESEGIEMTEVGKKADKADGPEMSAPKSSASFSSMAEKVLSSLATLAKGVASTMKGPSADAAPTADNTATATTEDPSTSMNLK